MYRARQDFHNGEGDSMDKVEVRAFGDLKRLFDERGWPFPLFVDLPAGARAADLARELDIPLDKVEVVFVNGRVRRVDCSLAPGDRVAFVPPGTPGPYRVLLGFMDKGRGAENS